MKKKHDFENCCDKIFRDGANVDACTQNNVIIHSFLLYLKKFSFYIDTLIDVTKENINMMICEIYLF